MPAVLIRREKHTLKSGSIGRPLAIFIDGPSQWHRLFPSVVDFNFSVCNGCCGHIKQEHLTLCLGNGDSDGIGAQKALSAEGGNPACARVRKRHSHHILLSDFFRPQTGHTVMVGVFYRTKSGPHFFCLGNRLFNGKIRDIAAHTIMSVYDKRNGRFPYDGRICSRLGESLIPIHSVESKARDAMRGNAACVRLDQNPGGQFRLFF